MRLFSLILLIIGFGTTHRMFAAPDQTLIDAITVLAEGNKTERAEALDTLVNTGDPRLGSFFESYRTSSIFLLDGKPYVGGDIYTDDDLNNFVPLTSFLTGEKVLNDDGSARLVPVGDLVQLDPSRKERKRARAAMFLLGLKSEITEDRLQAAKRSGFPPYQPEALPLLKEMAESDPVEAIRYTASVSSHLLTFNLPDTPVQTKVDSIHELGLLQSLRALSLVEAFIDSDTELTAEQRSRCERALRNIQTHATQVHIFDNAKFGLSTGSIYILMALGLAIIYGLMGVINMAHGEMMMIGAYTTFVTQSLFGHSPETPANHYFFFAIPASFIVAAAVGWVIEKLVVNKLYHRPFESLLATVGVSFILIQIIRIIFGDNRSINSPSWLVGGFDVVRDMNLSYNRIFIFGLTIACVVGLQLLMRLSSFGLKVRATMQHRDMASCMGVNTRKVYSLTFMLGSGLAGLAGCALTTISGITPDMGQNYIVDSFLIVVIGGVGELLGVVLSGLGIGISVQLLENSFFSPVWAKIIILGLVVLFIQFRPAGLFPPKGRLADV